MLTKAQLAAWLADLRDPANASLQGKGCLRSVDDKFCCLGRLANIIDPNGWTNEDPTAPAMWRHPIGKDAYASGAREKRDIFIDPDLVPWSAQETLSYLNDGSSSRSPMRFPMIAEKIQEFVDQGQIPVADDPS